VIRPGARRRIPGMAAAQLCLDDPGTPLLMLPYAAARTGPPEPVGVHLVLTGPGGGTWDVASTLALD
jgi:hypothetical protein